MPSIERKSIDRIKPGDNLVADAGVFAKAGQPIDEKTIKLFARHKVIYVPTISLTYEEADRLKEEQKKEYLLTAIKKLGQRFHNTRIKLVEKVSSLYVPFSELDSGFGVKGKKKQLTKNILLEPDPGPLYQPDIDAGSEQLMSQNNIRYLRENLSAVYVFLEKLTRRDKETRGSKNRIPRQLYYSIRLHSCYEGPRISTVGNAVPWHAVDTALYFLVTMTNINKKRIVEGLPLSESRFDPDSKTTDETVYRYHSEYIVEAALGVLLHGIGYSQDEVHALLSAKPLLDGTDTATKKRVRVLQRNINVAKNLLRNRRDISSISRMMVTMQKEFPDGTGFPPLNENRFIHEFVRLVQIIDEYDLMTNPILGRVPYCRQDVIDYLWQNSGEYRYVKERFVKQKRYDRNLLSEFLEMLAPYEIGEKVYLYEAGNSSVPRCVGRVFSYLDSYIPLISILKDERTGKTYPYGSLLFYLPGSLALVMENSAVKKKSKVDWIGNLRIVDSLVSPGSIDEYRDYLFGNERVLAKRFR